MDDLPPPTVHTLRPHHISLLAVFLLLFKEYEASLPLPFTLHVYRVLLNQVSEARLPMSTCRSEFSAICIGLCPKITPRLAA